MNVSFLTAGWYNILIKFKTDFACTCSGKEVFILVMCNRKMGLRNVDTFPYIEKDS